MNQRIEQGLAQGIVGHRKFLDAMDTLVTDGGLEIFHLQCGNRGRDLGEKIAMHLVVVSEVGLGAEESDFHESAAHEALRILMEQQHGSALQ